MSVIHDSVLNYSVAISKKYIWYDTHIYILTELCETLTGARAQEETGLGLTYRILIT